MMLRSLTLLVAGAASALAGFGAKASGRGGGVVTETWNIEWLDAAPDGTARPVIGQSFVFSSFPKN